MKKGFKIIFYIFYWIGVLDYFMLVGASAERYQSVHGQYSPTLYGSMVAMACFIYGGVLIFKQLFKKL